MAGKLCSCGAAIHESEGFCDDCWELEREDLDEMDLEDQFEALMKWKKRGAGNPGDQGGEGR